MRNSARARPGLAAVVCGLAWLATGCAAELQSEAPTDDPTERRRRTRAYERHAAPVENLRITATLWDAALLGTDAAATEHWRARYLEDTTFTVVLELANRPGPPRRNRVEHAEQPDIAVDPSRWRFSLASGESHREPSSVFVQGIDRFPTRAGGWHWRIVLGVKFEGAAHELSDEDHPLVLRAYPPPPHRGRSEWGNMLIRRGVALRWWLGAT